MPFTWLTGNLTTSDTVDADHLTEIQDNVDWVDDNLACWNHNSTVLTDHDSGHDTAHYSGHYNTEFTSELASHDNGQNLTYNISFCGSNLTSYDSFHYTSHLVLYYSSNDGAHYISNDASYNINYLAVHDNSYNNGFNLTP